jgi:3-oxoacyl-[acyl-carrier-protein] synthase II
MSEGAGAMILEPLEAALSSNRQVFGLIAGAGDCTDNFHRTRSHPSGDTIVRSMISALKDAGISTEEVDYINAHGTSTPENDKMEAFGIARVFGCRMLPVSSNKSMIGHTLTAAGIIEAIFSLLSISKGVLLPTINYRNPDPGIRLDVVPNEAREQTARFVLSNSFGFGGQNVSLVLGSAEQLQ